MCTTRIFMYWHWIMGCYGASSAHSEVVYTRSIKYIRRDLVWESRIGGKLSVSPDLHFIIMRDTSFTATHHTNTQHSAIILVYSNSSSGGGDLTLFFSCAMRKVVRVDWLSLTARIYIYIYMRSLQLPGYNYAAGQVWPARHTLRAAFALVVCERCRGSWKLAL